VGGRGELWKTFHQGQEARGKTALDNGESTVNDILNVGFLSRGSSGVERYDSPVLRERMVITHRPVLAGMVGLFLATRQASSLGQAAIFAGGRSL